MNSKSARPSEGAGTPYRGSAVSAGPFLRPSQGQVQGNVPATEDIRPRQIEGTLTLPRCIEKAPPSPLGLEVISFEQPDQTPPAQQAEGKEDCAQQG